MILLVLIILRLFIILILQQNWGSAAEAVAFKSAALLGSIFDQFLILCRGRPKSLKYSKTNEKSTFLLPLGIIFPIKFRSKFWSFSGTLSWTSFFRFLDGLGPRCAILGLSWRPAGVPDDALNLRCCEKGFQKANAVWTKNTSWNQLAYQRPREVPKDLIFMILDVFRLHFSLNFCNSI